MISDKVLAAAAAAAFTTLTVCSSALIYSHYESSRQAAGSGYVQAIQENVPSDTLSAIEPYFPHIPASDKASEAENKTKQAAYRDSDTDYVSHSANAITEEAGAAYTPPSGSEDNASEEASHSGESIYTENSIDTADITDAESSIDEEAENGEHAQSSSTASIPESSYAYIQRADAEIPEMHYASFAYNDYNVILDTAIGPMMYYNQHDSHWGSYLYGGKDTMSGYGCGPTTAAMIVNAFGNVKGHITPIEMADWSASYGYYAPHSGSYHDYIPAVLSAFDLMVDSVQDRRPENVAQVLRDGNILVALMGKGALTNGGHFIIITRLNQNGTVSIADPNSFNTSSREWSLTQLMNELKKNYDAGAPLWSVRPLAH